MSPHMAKIVGQEYFVYVWTLGSDDPAYFPGYMNENLSAVQQEVDLNEEELLQLCRNAFEVSWLVEKDKKRYLHRLDAVSRSH